MTPYQPPLRDIQFVAHELLAAEGAFAQLAPHRDIDSATINAVAEEAAKFCAEVLHPLNKVGDREGCRMIAPGVVATPAGFKEAYAQYVAGGWPGLACATEWGGQGLPLLLSVIRYEMLGASNQAWAGYPGLSHGVYAALEAHGTPEQKATYLPKLASGEWTGTMCLTESQCGSDLGLITTRAEPMPDGSYRLSGTKIFISSGEHDLAENIVHLVLARIVGAPAGSRGISLFVVPKYLPGVNDSLGERNGVQCGSIEHKMGTHGNCTCVMNFDEAVGSLVGEANAGLRAMFVMMNAARVGVGVQSVGVSQYAYQTSVAYARERNQMRAPSGPTRPEQSADPIIVHPDIRRMLLTQKVWTEGGRALAYWTALLIDQEESHPDPEFRRECTQLVSLFTPIVKAFLSDNAGEATSFGIQVRGGHGYISESGIEQYARDTRIATIYEGTNGIQALDLLGRKVLADRGETLGIYLRMVRKFAAAHEARADMQEFLKPLNELAARIERTLLVIGTAASRDAFAVGASANHFLRVLGHLCFAHLWARMAAIALDRVDDDAVFYGAKLGAARFYFQRLLTETDWHFAAIVSGAESLKMPDELFV